MRFTRVLAVLGLAIVGGCGFNSGGVGSASATLGGSDDTSGDMTGPSTGSADTGGVDTSGGVTTTDPNTTTTTGMTTVDPTTGDTTSDTATTDGGQVGDAVLEISDGPSYDYGPVPTGTSQDHTFTVTNVGTATATDLTGAAFAGPFSYAGGVFPGSGGDCGNMLPASTSCTVVVSFSPVLLGPISSTLVVEYVDAVPKTAARDVMGGGAGTSAELVENGGAESQGDPPPGWVDVVGGGWYTSSYVSAHSGNYSFRAGSGPNDSALVLRQDVDVSSFASAIGSGTLKFDFSLWVRTFEWDNDYYRFLVQYRDNQGTELDSYGIGWQTGPSWSEYADIRTAPPGTREIRINLACIKGGGSDCDAFFDDVSLRATYP